MRKSILLFCLTIILCLTCSCKRQADDTPAGSGYDGKYICEQTYFAFIDESNNVVVKNVDGERKITDTGSQDCRRRSRDCCAQRGWDACNVCSGVG